MVFLTDDSLINRATRVYEIVLFRRLGAVTWDMNPAELMERIRVAVQSACLNYRYRWLDGSSVG